MVLIRLTSDNFDDELITVDAYEEVALTMSTGDYGTHRAAPVVMPANDPRIVDAEALSIDILID